MSTRGRNVSVIFGDGAGAALVTRYDGNDDRGILSSHLHSEGKHAEELSLIGPSTNRWVPQIMEENDPEDTSYYPNMNGQFVFKNAVVRFSEVIKEGLLQNQLAAEGHQIVGAPQGQFTYCCNLFEKKFGLGEDQVYNNIQSATVIPQLHLFQLP